jgi:hypothetical protein
MPGQLLVNGLDLDLEPEGDDLAVGDGVHDLNRLSTA